MRSALLLAVAFSLGCTRSVDYYVEHPAARGEQLRKAAADPARYADDEDVRNAQKAERLVGWSPPRGGESVAWPSPGRTTRGAQGAAQDSYERAGRSSFAVPPNVIPGGARR